MRKTFASAAIAAIGIVSIAGAAQARDQISIVGSSTVFPFTTAVAEQFARAGGFQAPVVESTGTGGGMRIFCGGVGEAHPDVTGASRAMKSSEYENCVANGVDSITEILVGFDGIAMAGSREGVQFDVTKAELFAALAAEVEVNGEIVANPHQLWSDINPNLPDIEIRVFGPPPTSGTRDAWVELVMEKGCEEYGAIAALEDSNEGRFEQVCQTMREDGLFIEAGENDNLIVQRLTSDPTTYGIFGFSFLDQNADVLQGVKVGGFVPTFEAIADGDYPVSRPLFVYIKNAHRGVIPGLDEFVAEYTSERAMGDEGYLIDRGLIPLSEDERSKVQMEAAEAIHLSRFGS